MFSLFLQQIIIMKIYAYLLVTIASLLLINACSDTQKKQSLPTNNTELAEEELWVDMLVEIPAGSIKKFELNKQNGLIEMDSIDGKPRFIQYLGYPANYGMIPNTLLPLDKGGDGDPLDILSIGPVAQSGELIKCRIIGVLKLLDRGEQDDKLIAISKNSTLSNIKTLEDLKLKYPGILEIIETWFSNYKGPNKIKSQGFKSIQDAITILEKAQLEKN